MHARYPDLLLVVLSGSEQLADVNGAINHGARGYIPKSEPPAVMLAAIKLVLNGGVYLPHLKGQEELAARSKLIKLTSRQMDVLKCLALGEPNKLIARKLDISEGTVKTHVDAIMNILSARNRTQAVLLAQQLGLVE
jgi:DNA-binding NarL/FixJ family response regulator